MGHGVKFCVNPRTKKAGEGLWVALAVYLVLYLRRQKFTLDLIIFWGDQGGLRARQAWRFGN